MDGHTITAQDDGSSGVTHDYTFTLCGNGAGTCSEGNLGQLMVKQTYQQLCEEISLWNDGVTPTYEEGKFTFVYANGAPCSNQPRQWQPSFICDSGVNGFSAGTVTESGGIGACVYYVDIRTKYACPGVTCDASDDSSGLSGGWIFIIILLVGFFVYC